MTKLSENLLDMRKEMNMKLDQVESGTKDNFHILRAVKERLLCLEEKLNPAEPFVPVSLEKQSKEEMLAEEVRCLKKTVDALQRDNESLRNFHQPRTRAAPLQNLKVERVPTIPKFEDSSFSPIKKLRSKQPGNHSLFSKNIQDFKLESEASQSNQDSPLRCKLPKEESFNGSENNSVRTSKGKKIPLKVNFTGFNLIPSLRRQNMRGYSLLESSQDSCAEGKEPTPEEGPASFALDSFLDKEKSINPGSRQNEKPPQLSLANIKNFDDFQHILKDLKKTLHTSTYASFNEEVDENIRLLEEVLQKYSLIDQQIYLLYQKTVCSSLTFEKRGSVHFKEMPTAELPSLALDKKSNSAILSTNPHFLLSQLQELRESSNLDNFQVKLMEVQKNPSEFESLLYTIKRELRKRQAEFTHLENQILINH